jgi:hypothetical protein
MDDKMTKKLIHTFIILNIIFFAISSYSLAIQTNKECQRKCGNTCECEKDSTKLKNNDCSCSTNHPPSLLCYINYTKNQISVEELESMIEPPDVLISVLPFVYNRIEKFSERKIFLYLYQVDCSPPF